ncbi:MAG: glycoside hydrolase family protein [Armatimonadota bacterium]
MKPVSFSHIKISGDILSRALCSFDRMEREEYQPPQVFHTDPDGLSYEWPADWEGRTILALVLLTQATGRSPVYLDAIMSELPKYFNKAGYMGKVLEDGIIDEQQLSGNSWLLRALCELYLWRKEPSVLLTIEGMVRGLYLPARSGYTTYPTKPEQRKYDGEAIGSLAADVEGNWISSSDIGCAFIALDGVTQAYGILRWPELKELIDVMVAKYLEVDFMGISAQTHATLSGLRGVMRMAEYTQNEEYLAQAVRIYKLYMDYGVTENYENYNWFGRPHWTEPCAVVDSYILAIWLWQATGEPEYLADAHRIYYSGLGYGQRPNGGFGTNTCAGADTQILAPKEATYEAFWCCTMRGGEGMSKATEYTLFQDEYSLWVTMLNSIQADVVFPDGTMKLEIETDYPAESHWRMQVLSNTTSNSHTLKVYMPYWVLAPKVKLDGEFISTPVERGFVSVAIPAGSCLTVEITWENYLREESPRNTLHDSNLRSLWHGPLMLGLQAVQGPMRLPLSTELQYEGSGFYRWAGVDEPLKPVRDLISMDNDKAIHDSRLVLFMV